MRRTLALTLALAWLAAPSPLRADESEHVGWTLAQFAEDTYFERTRLTRADASAIIADDMTEAACVHAMRLVNAWGAFTACVPTNR